MPVGYRNLRKTTALNALERLLLTFHLSSWMPGRLVHLQEKFSILPRLANIFDATVSKPSTQENARRNAKDDQGI